MNRPEYFTFMRETAGIAIDMDTGFAYAPVVNFRKVLYLQRSIFPSVRGGESQNRARSHKSP